MIAAILSLLIGLPRIVVVPEAPSGRVVHCSFDLNPNHPGERMEFWDEPDHGDGMYCEVTD